MSETITPNTELDMLYGTTTLHAGGVELKVRKVLTRGNQRALTRMRRSIAGLQNETAEIRTQLDNDAKAETATLTREDVLKLIDRVEEIDEEIAPMHWACIQLLCVDPPEVLSDSSSDVLATILVGALLAQMKSARTIISEENPDHPLSESTGS